MLIEITSCVINTETTKRNREYAEYFQYFW